MTLDAEVPPRMTSGPRTPPSRTGRRRLLLAAASAARPVDRRRRLHGRGRRRPRPQWRRLGGATRDRSRAFSRRQAAGHRGTRQAYAAFVAFDLVADADADTVRRLLQVWSDDIERLMGGRADRPGARTRCAPPG